MVKSEEFFIIRETYKIVLISSSIRDFVFGKWTLYPTPTQHKLCMSSRFCSAQKPEPRERQR